MSDIEKAAAEYVSKAVLYQALEASNVYEQARAALRLYLDEKASR